VGHEAELSGFNHSFTAIMEVAGISSRQCISTWLHGVTIQETGIVEMWYNQTEILQSFSIFTKPYWDRHGAWTVQNVG
jgi:hypothetical protein